MACSIAAIYENHSTLFTDLHLSSKVTGFNFSMLLLDSHNYNSSDVIFLMKNQYSGRLCWIGPLADPDLFPFSGGVPLL